MRLLLDTCTLVLPADSRVSRGDGLVGTKRETNHELHRI
jgi:hypothetical protein